MNQNQIATYRTLLLGMVRALVNQDESSIRRYESELKSVISNHNTLTDIKRKSRSSSVTEIYYRPTTFR